MMNGSASLVMSTSVLKALPGKLDIKKRHSPISVVISLPGGVFVQPSDLVISFCKMALIRATGLQVLQHRMHHHMLYLRGQKYLNIALVLQDE